MKPLPHARFRAGDRRRDRRAGPPPAPPRPRRRLLLLLLAGLLVAAGGTWAVLEFVVWNKLPRDLVGKWVVVEGEMEGATFEFHRDGAMVAREDDGVGRRVLPGRAEVRDKILYVRTRDEVGEDVTLTHTIRELGERRLVLETEQGKLLKLERAEE